MPSLFGYIEEAGIKKRNFKVLYDGNRSITYGELYLLLATNQRKLRQQGFVEGEKVLLKINRQLDFVIAFLSFLSVGCWVIPIPKDMIDNEFKRIHEHTGGKVFFGDETLNIFEFTNGEKTLQLLKPNEDHCGIYHLTSGSTGKPKLCIRTTSCLFAEAESYRKTLSLNEEDRILSTSPLYHSYAMGAALFSSIVAGGCLFLIDKFIPRKVLRIIHERQITVMILVPTLARALSIVFTEDEFNLSSLRIVLVGAGPIIEKVYKTFKNRYGVPLLSNYGSTETGGIISRLTPLPMKSIGKPMEGVEVKICDDNGNELPVGEEGELWVKCAGMLKGYLGEETVLLDKDGYFPMGDIVQQDEEKNIYIKGRKKLMINIGGEKVNPYEIEDVILSYPNIKECVVIGVNKLNGDEAVKAIIVGSGIKEDELRRYCKEKLSIYKIPSVIEFRSSIFKNPLGKIKRGDLAMS